MPTPGDRIEALDLIRGVAVLGILAINIAGFAGPPVSILSPNLPNPGSQADTIAFSLNFILFEGKMRALFSLLFGASMVLSVERADAAGRFGDLLQVKRLGWLAIFGLLHFYLLWWGDILFLYAISGMIALLVREAPLKPLLIAALAIFLIWHGTGAAMSAPEVLEEERVLAVTASQTEADGYAKYLKAVDDNARGKITAVSGSFVKQAAYRAGRETLMPLATAFTTMGETLPLMLLGIVLCRAGFFAGGWDPKRMVALATIMTGTGLALTLLLLGLLLPRGFPPRAMEAAFLYWTAIPHLLMGIGYAAILVLSAPAIGRSFLGRRIAAAGRMAFSNYIGTTILMTGIFYGWGLGLIGQFGHAKQWIFVILGWAVMLTWSKPWLSRYQRGPLEWIWRSLVEKRILTNRR